ncbi:nucleotidyltransferase family protein [Cryobacterium sp. TMT2-14]|uniref:nucleotidyltransferase family protein n=1 Tax=Cryobacterium sp. TMT2-14 TaxID=1259245 RepID=UPI00106A51CB|nr:nucleotidyltransferase family protein [Cryobacterium sp. TMT2-14]TFC38850.1 nucleotidyltransferase family protein [Cryobacterium sp. TMT2-14]
MATSSAPIAGLVLAAGAGSRYGMPKALAQGDDGIPWLVRTIRTLTDAGCSPVIVVLGAETAEVRALLHQFGMTPSVVLTQAEDWAEGLSASLRAGLRQATELQATELLPAPVAVAIVPVDIPGLLPGTVARLIGTLPIGTLPIDTLPGDTVPGATDADANPVGPLTLRQAGFDARPGHPVVIGRAHWGALIDSATGDTGARPYLQSHNTRLVDCADLETGLDVDTRD